MSFLCVPFWCLSFFLPCFFPYLYSFGLVLISLLLSLYLGLDKKNVPLYYIMYSNEVLSDTAYRVICFF